jgi:hypothetical protein
LERLAEGIGIQSRHEALYSQAESETRQLKSEDWRDGKYREEFERTLRGLEGRRERDPSFAMADAEGTLKHLYINEGNDQGGRGELQDIILGAAIAAYEHFIAEWKASASREPLAKE